MRIAFDLYLLHVQSEYRVEPASGKPEPGQYTFSISLRANGIVRSLGEPVILRLQIHPQSLQFVVLWVQIANVGY